MQEKTGRRYTLPATPQSESADNKGANNKDANKSDAGKRQKATRTKVIVALKGFGDESALPTTATAQGNYAANRAAYTACKESARTQQAEVIAYLEAHKDAGSWRKVSAPTAFGTFTLEATAEVIALLNRAPGVDSVLPVDDAPLTLLASAAGSGPAATSP